MTEHPLRAGASPKNLEPVVARKTWRTLEPVHGMVYFAAEADEQYQAAGLLPGRMGYFASRSAPLGAPPAEVVIATFYNFNPNLVRRVIPAAWEHATPERVLDARLTVVDLALRRMLGDLVATPELATTAALARRAAETACDHADGRPLFAAHASLPWPDEPHLELWHAQTLLREFRGDGHVAALVTNGISGIEALMTHAASGEIPAEVLRASRAWSADEWAAAADGLRARGVLTGDQVPTFTDAGRELRQHVEDVTDSLAASAYGTLGDDGCARLRGLARPLSRRLVAAGALDASGATAEPG